MEPVTINLEGLTEFGPYGYLLAYVLVTAAVGAFARRHIRLAGETTGDAQSSHIATGVVTTVLGLILFLVTLSGADDMFDSSIATAQRNLEAQERAHVAADRAAEPPPFNTYVVWASDDKAYAITTSERTHDVDITVVGIKDQDGNVVWTPDLGYKSLWGSVARAQNVLEGSIEEAMVANDFHSLHSDLSINDTTGEDHGPCND